MATPIEIENKRKYLKGPTMTQIDTFIKECGVSARRFESFFGMPDGTIKVVRSGYMKLPVKYWHIFYDKIVPVYGVGVETPTEVPKPAIKKVIPPVAVKREEINIVVHSRLSNLR